LIDFVHSSFKEYLLAEYYIESLLEKKTYRLNARIPSKDTIDFLNGIIALLQEENPDIQQFVSGDPTGLLKSFDIRKGKLML